LTIEKKNSRSHFQKVDNRQIGTIHRKKEFWTVTKELNFQITNLKPDPQGKKMAYKNNKCPATS
jgi:hypothetical protein